VVLAHLIGGLATLAGLWWHLLQLARGASLAARMNPFAASASSLSWLAPLALLVVVLQIMLGGWTSTNYAALACTDFPTCHGYWWPEMDFGEGFVLWRGLGINYEYGVLDTPARTAIHWTHRLGAVLTAMVVIAAVISAWGSRAYGVQTTAWCILAALSTQLCLGVANVLGGLPLAVAVAHNGVAALLLLSLLSLVYFTRRN